MKILLSPCSIVLCLFFTFQNLYSQENVKSDFNRMEYGIGIGLNYSGYNQSFESSNLFDGMSLLPAVHIRGAYKFSPKLKLSLGPGISWKGNEVSEPIVGEDLIGVYIDLPLLLHADIYKNLSILGGFEGSYLVQLGNKDSVFPDGKMIYAAKMGVGYSIGNLVELNFSYSHGLTDVFSLEFTNLNGQFIDTGRWKNKVFQLGIVFRQ